MLASLNLEDEELYYFMKRENVSQEKKQKVEIVVSTQIGKE